MNITVDAHEDLAWNIVALGRDYTQNAHTIRAREAAAEMVHSNGSTLLGKDDWIKGEVGVIFATLFASPIRKRVGSWDSQVYRDAQEAYKLASAQLDAYHRLADGHPQFRVIGSKADLGEVLISWDDNHGSEDRLLGFVPLMEGADPIVSPDQVAEWFERGLRIIGLAWESTRYAGGTHEPGPLTPEGHELLAAMADYGLTLDLSHLAEQSYYEAIDRYEGRVIASHANPRRFCPTPRGLSDEMIGLLAQRDGVMGIVPYNRFLKPGWQKGDPREQVTLEDVADAIDHVCQVTGSTRYVGLGTDFDGGFGVEAVPVGIDTIADLPLIRKPLAARGYEPDQIDAIMGGNWLRLLEETLPD